MAILAVAFGAPLIVVVALKSIAADLGVSRATVALASALVWLGAGLGGIGLGWVSGRIGLRRVAVFGGIMVALGCQLAAQGETWQLLLGFGLLVGLLGNGALFPPLMAYVSLWFDRRRGTALALVSSGQYVAGSLWPAPLERAVAAWGWQATMQGSGLIVLAVVVPVALWLLRPPPALPVAGSAGAGPAPGARVLGMPPNLALFVLGVASLLCCVPMAMPAAHLVAFCSDRGIAAAEGAAMLSVLLAAAFLARQGWGWVADRIGGLRTVLLGNLAQTLGMALFLVTEDEAGLFLVAALYGLGFSGIIPAYMLAIRELFPASEAAWRVPALLFLSLTGMALGAWLAGALFDAAGTYALPWAVGIGVNLVQLAVIGVLVARDRAPAGAAASAARPAASAPAAATGRSAPES